MRSNLALKRLLDPKEVQISQNHLPKLQPLFAKLKSELCLKKMGKPRSPWEIAGKYLRESEPFHFARELLLKSPTFSEIATYDFVALNYLLGRFETKDGKFF